MRTVIAFLALLTTFFWFLSDQNDCHLRWMRAEQWLACVTGRNELDEALTKLEAAMSRP